jgi:hypothetical protein
MNGVGTESHTNSLSFPGVKPVPTPIPNQIDLKLISAIKSKTYEHGFISLVNKTF